MEVFVVKRSSSRDLTLAGLFIRIAHCSSIGWRAR